MARDCVADLRTWPKKPRSTVLSVEEEAIVIAFRRHTLLPLDHCSLFASNDIPHLTRSSLHRCLQRHGISRLPERRRQAREEAVLLFAIQERTSKHAAKMTRMEPRITDLIHSAGL